MKKASILACVLLLASVATLAQAPPSHPPLTEEALAAILGLPAAGSCAAQPSGVREVAKRPAIPTGKSPCTATAHCQFTTVSCSGSSTCTAVDANCSAGVSGYVICDGVKTSCPACCTGTFKQIQCCRCAQDGNCYSCCVCDGGTPLQCSRDCS